MSAGGAPTGAPADRSAPSPASRRRQLVWRRFADGLALALLVAFLVVAVPAAARTALWRIGSCLRHLGEPLAAARARLQGPAYAAAIDRLRATIPLDEPYLLIDRSRPGEAAAIWVRYELAPRRAVFFRGRDAADAGWLRRRVPRPVHWVVVAPGEGRPPTLYSRFEFMHGAAVGAG